MPSTSRLPRRRAERASPIPERRVVSLPSARSADAELVARLHEGKPAAFAELFDRFAGMVRGALLRTLGSEADLDDLVQDTFIVVVNRCHTLRDPAALRSFVYSVAIRTARNELRRRAFRRWIPLGSVPEPDLAVHDDDGTVGEALRRTYALLDQLRADQRVAFVLRRVEGHELAEAARLSGCSLATFKRRLARAERRFEAMARTDPALRSLLEPEEGER